MNIFFAGATGAIGRHILPRMIEEGHTVTALTRSSTKAEHLRTLGAQPVVGDVLDRAFLLDAVRKAQPEVVMHQLTSVPPRIDPRHIDVAFAQTNTLRTKGTALLMEAARAAGARTFIAQSIAAFYTPTRITPATEAEPLYRDAPAAFADTIQAVATLEDTVLSTPGIRGIVLRYGLFYGPGTAYDQEGSIRDDIEHRRFPIIGDGSGVFSFIHVDDAAKATMLAMEKDQPGIYNIVDDEPAPVREWMPVYATLLGAPRPRRIPRFIGRLAAGRYGLFFMTKQRGASNRKAKSELGWTPTFPSWRYGFRDGFGAPRAGLVLE